jgi:pyrophosphatase PpaX
VSPEPRVLCVIFDIDGTLTRTSELIFASFNHVASKYIGRTLTPREITALFGPPEEVAIARVVGDQDAPAAMSDLCSYYRDQHRSLASLHHGIEEVLRFLKEKNIRLAVFTGKGKRTAEITLGELQIAAYFDLIVSGNDVQHHKPHPEGIQKVLRAFDVHPRETLMIGDTVSDVRASRSAGVRMAAVLWDSYDKDRLLETSTDLRFFEVAEMFAWFRSHLN